MSFFAENWLVLLFAGGMLALHLFGHGHGRGGNKKAQGRVNSPKAPSDAKFGDPAANRNGLPQKPKIKLANVIEDAEFATTKPKT